ncbi:MULTISPECIES: amino acid ABC transporter permease [Bacillus]|jgi:polar amino acid transport system permease protein|uniref:Amino acid ABC transporter permease n=8 Tax=Bacillus cereus group TaxID=86661 RepID=A0A0G8CQ33_BACCE|nr:MULTISPECIES: amino acid ABC transporter permease [Bacillus]AAS45058.1 amino acid ABC transporter, permease protein [Bacillus cereus ATCC 10987]EEK75720.1 Amino acid ABC transporter, permease protein [Bacillus cereus R309803]KXY85006.1 amino acid ABC transporter permease [Bacillus wiedmannii]MCO4219694.1 amino acid ABC transporter permease [Bacillus sp. 10017]MDV8113525.1 amino acid ABC transporter permease [Bacillus sp. BAU-SS-2023]CJC82963.1 amino acid ABC transporter permease [Streptoco
MSFDYINSILMPMLEGAQMTVLLFLIAIVVSIPMGFLLTLAVRSNLKPLSWLAQGYIYVLRGTPLLLQLLFICFGLPLLPVIGEYLVMDRFVAACLGFILNYAAYFAEIFRGGLLAIDKGQYEASQVLGLSKWQTMRRVILPQMFRIALPAVANESVTLIKDTALLYAVAVPELLHFAQTAVNRDFTITPFFVAGLIYLIMTLVLTMFFKWLERRFKFE